MLLILINDVAPPERHADVLSSFYVVTYIGSGLPVIGVGFLATAIGLLTAVQYSAAGVPLPASPRSRDKPFATSTLGDGAPRSTRSDKRPRTDGWIGTASVRPPS